ncbi:MAG TPA: AraC family transcriptional regulator [Clostridium sp.]|uniref:AraC family transcriptional regulator n=1 Tax=Clostridium sp. TaxID=1506 RepID=UPI002F95A287
MNSIDVESTISNINLNIYYCGSQECKPGHSWGPAVKEHYKIHYVNKGKGSFNIGNKTYLLEEGQGFLICPNVISYYKADNKDPWKYTWVAFDGTSVESYLKRANLSVENPIFKVCDEEMSQCLNQMVTVSIVDPSRDLRLISLLYLFIDIIINRTGSAKNSYKSVRHREPYIENVIEFIEINYSQKILITEISNHMGIDRKYLSTIFKAAMGISIQKYLIDYRMNKACNLMQNYLLSIGDISRSVGYDDPLVFSKMFKYVIGVSPRKYRNMYIWK